MTTRIDLAARHLALRLRPLNRALRAAVARQAQIAAQLLRPDVAPLCVTDDQVRTLLTHLDSGPGHAPIAADWQLTDQEFVLEKALRATATEKKMSLPLDALVERGGLNEIEVRALLICAAPALERSYERVLAYVLDDLNRRYPCVELVLQLCATDLTSRLQLQALLGSNGRLRRRGYLHAEAEASTELRRVLRPGEGFIDFLSSADRAYLDARHDREVVVWPNGLLLPATIERATVERLAPRIHDGRIDCLGLWGGESRGATALLHELAKSLGVEVRRLQREPGLNAVDAAGNAMARAAALDALLWIDLDGLEAPALAELQHAIEVNASTRKGLLVLTATHPWRSLALLQTRRYDELQLPNLDFPDQRDLLDRLHIHESAEVVESVAARYRLGPAEAAALATVARQRTASNGKRVDPTPEQLDDAARLVTRRASSSFATVIEPRRQPTDLVLPEPLHRQVVQVAEFYRAWPRLRHEWKLERLANGSEARVLLTGESGTGKTLAAEVIAGLLGMPLMKVELSQVVSRWVGVTEQQLDCVFREAAAMRAVLFIDEADALLGKRGEVRHGVDRYSNYEVAFLLQKMESSELLDLPILFATNLKDNIDSAFTRRFRFIIHFPRPTETDRRRIWRLALPEKAPLAPDVDLDRFAHLDMTGAGIVSAARTAALLAASQNGLISFAHLVDGVERQFRQEARMLLDADLQLCRRRDGTAH